MRSRVLGGREGPGELLRGAQMGLGAPLLSSES